jgi:hypothetical protein
MPLYVRGNYSTLQKFSLVHGLSCDLLAAALGLMRGWAHCDCDFRRELAIHCDLGGAGSDRPMAQRGIPQYMPNAVYIMVGQWRGVEVHSSWTS